MSWLFALTLSFVWGSIIGGIFGTNVFSIFVSGIGGWFIGWNHRHIYNFVMGVK